MIDHAHLECPYCGEAFQTRVDLSIGDMDYVEDCPHCCRPIEMKLRVGEEDAEQDEGDSWDDPDDRDPDDLPYHRPSFSLQALRDSD